MTDAPKCAHCGGWGHEPEVFPLTSCTLCHGSGRPPAEQAAASSAGNQKELLDG